MEDTQPGCAASIARALGGSESETSKAHQWAGQAREVPYHQRARGAPPAAVRSPRVPLAGYFRIEWFKDSDAKRRLP